jgi:5-methylthioadenosine/S-adenosylhomocysteine deaminase
MTSLLAAKYVLPVSAEPIIDGGVAIEGGIIRGVGHREELLSEFPNAEVEDFREAAIIPGLVNCHSHLELTAMRGALDSVEHDFRAWLLKVQELRSAMSDADIVAAAIAGAREGAAAGVTCFADIGRFGLAGLNALKSVGLRGVV